MKLLIRLPEHPVIVLDATTANLPTQDGGEEPWFHAACEHCGRVHFVLPGIWLADTRDTVEQAECAVSAALASRR